MPGSDLTTASGTAREAGAGAARRPLAVTQEAGVRNASGVEARLAPGPAGGRGAAGAHAVVGCASGMLLHPGDASVPRSAAAPTPKVATPSMDKIVAAAAKKPPPAPDVHMGASDGRP